MLFMEEQKRPCHLLVDGYSIEERLLAIFGYLQEVVINKFVILFSVILVFIGLPFHRYTQTRRL
jgi:hypothetical protein